jgi:hypothetical protein
VPKFVRSRRYRMPSHFGTATLAGGLSSAKLWLTLLSYFSVGSILRCGRVLSIGSVGSILSNGNAGSILSIKHISQWLGLRAIAGMLEVT